MGRSRERPETPARLCPTQTNAFVREAVLDGGRAVSYYDPPEEREQEVRYLMASDHYCCENGDCGNYASIELIAAEDSDERAGFFCDECWQRIQEEL